MEGEIATSQEAAPVDTQTNDAPQTETAQTSEQQTQETQQQGKPEGFDPVEFTPEQKARFDRVYGNMKRYEQSARKVPELEQANQILAEQLKALHENQNKIVTHIQAEDYKSAEQQLKADRQAAWQAGNSQAYDDANDRLRDLSVRRAMAEMQPPKQTQIPQQPYMPKVSGEAVLERATQQGVISQDEATTYRAWMDEADTNGNARRPWINENDPRNGQAAAIGKAVFNSPAMQTKSFGEKLKEIDRLMGIQQPQANQNVLPNGNLTRPKQNNNVKLSDYETKIAIKTKFGGPKAKSDADHVEAWRAAKVKSQQKGSR
jgi:hypothetical protein